MGTTLFKLTKNLGGALLKATVITLVSQLAATEMRSCGRDLNEKFLQNIRYIRNRHARV